MNTSSFSTPLLLGKEERKRTDAHQPAQNDQQTWMISRTPGQHSGASVEMQGHLGVLHQADGSFGTQRDLSEPLHFFSPLVSQWQKCASILRNFLMKSSPGLICFWVSFFGFSMFHHFLCSFLQFKHLLESKQRGQIIFYYRLLARQQQQTADQKSLYRNIFHYKELYRTHIKVKNSKKLVVTLISFSLIKKKMSSLKILTLLFLYYFHMAQILRSFKKKKR